jgi:cell division septation protein DedD
MTPVGTLPAEPETDTEITLGTGKMLALFFGLVILCAVFFGMGFTMGKNSVRSAPELLPSPSTTARTSIAGRTATATATAPQTQTVEQPQATAPAANDSNSTAPAPNTQTSSQNQPPNIPTDPGQAFYVQVAAVSKQEDADALVEALKGHQYSAFIASQSSDKLFHVQVGPFTDIKQAEDIRAKLVGDGYSPILKK